MLQAEGRGGNSPANAGWSAQRAAPGQWCRKLLRSERAGPAACRTWLKAVAKTWGQRSRSGAAAGIRFPQRLPGSEVRRGEGALRLFQAGSAGVVTRLQLVLLAPDRHQGARERSHARLWRQYAGSLPPPRFWPPFSSRPTHAFPQPHPAECDLLEDKAGGTARRRFCSSLQQEVCSGRPFTELAD